MKTLAFTVTLMLSGTAFAQMTPPPETPAPSAMPAPETPPAGEMPAAPAAPATAMPTPEAPPAPTMAPMAAAPAPAPQAEYPRCSKTVTDQCVQGASRERDTKRKRRGS